MLSHILHQLTECAEWDLFPCDYGRNRGRPEQEPLNPCSFLQMPASSLESVNWILLSFHHISSIELEISLKTSSEEPPGETNVKEISLKTPEKSKSTVWEICDDNLILHNTFPHVYFIPSMKWWVSEIHTWKLEQKCWVSRSPVLFPK